MYPEIHLHPRHASRFLKGHPWVYSNELLTTDTLSTLQPGQLVELHYQQNTIAVGYYNKHSLIAFRALAKQKQEINTAFFITLLQKAVALRNQLYEMPFYRLIHAEADSLPGVIIDRFDNILMVQINTAGMERLQPLLIEALQTVLHPDSIYIEYDLSLLQKEGLSPRDPLFIGEPFQTLPVIENQARFSITLSDKQKTGWFFDHRDNRKWISHLAKGKSVLDYFCYRGGFSIQAALQGAQSVMGVDRSEAAICEAKQNATLNQVEERCHFICKEVFQDIEERTKSFEQFDIVVLDPPAFVKTKKDLPTGLKGYEKLIKLALPLVKPSGLLLIASCSYHVKKEDLLTCLQQALRKQNRVGKILKTLGAGYDHPIHPYLSESEYLKGFLLSLE